MKERGDSSLKLVVPSKEVLDAFQRLTDNFQRLKTGQDRQATREKMDEDLVGLLEARAAAREQGLIIRGIFVNAHRFRVEDLPEDELPNEIIHRFSRPLLRIRHIDMHNPRGSLLPHEVGIHHLAKVRHGGNSVLLDELVGEPNEYKQDSPNDFFARSGMELADATRERDALTQASRELTEGEHIQIAELGVIQANIFARMCSLSLDHHARPTIAFFVRINKQAHPSTPLSVRVKVSGQPAVFLSPHLTASHTGLSIYEHAVGVTHEEEIITSELSPSP